MSKLEKYKARIMMTPKDYTYSEAKKLLGMLGYMEYSKGKTSGSRMKFYRESDESIILLHKPHPGDVMSVGAVKDLEEYLRKKGELNEK